ncbi:hypothetical protein DPMN_029695 [Dreissena polymorpha]|uniref:Uncharacterized protein n=1 Tax=Dreissena polymorpha TaxID=45954 RepID=A0A9D4LZK4_DREPO|nr:hypothetical protein DPMN_029695 [Dreissena polymorpha]
MDVYLSIPWNKTLTRVTTRENSICTYQPSQGTHFVTSHHSQERRTRPAITPGNANYNAPSTPKRNMHPTITHGKAICTLPSHPGNAICPPPPTHDRNMHITSRLRNMHPASIPGTHNEPATSYGNAILSIHKPPERSMQPFTTSPLESQNASSNQPNAPRNHHL